MTSLCACWRAHVTLAARSFCTLLVSRVEEASCGWSLPVPRRGLRSGTLKDPLPNHFKGTLQLLATGGCKRQLQSALKVDRSGFLRDPGAATAWNHLPVGAAPPARLGSKAGGGRPPGGARTSRSLPRGAKRSSLVAFSVGTLTGASYWVSGGWLCPRLEESRNHRAERGRRGHLVQPPAAHWHPWQEQLLRQEVNSALARNFGGIFSS